MFPSTDAFQKISGFQDRVLGFSVLSFFNLSLAFRVFKKLELVLMLQFYILGVRFVSTWLIRWCGGLVWQAQKEWVFGVITAWGWWFLASHKILDVILLQHRTWLGEEDFFQRSRVSLLLLCNLTSVRPFVESPLLCSLVCFPGCSPPLPSVGWGVVRVPGSKERLQSPLPSALCWVGGWSWGFWLQMFLGSLLLWFCRFRQICQSRDHQLHSLWFLVLVRFHTSVLELRILLLISPKVMIPVRSCIHFILDYWTAVLCVRTQETMWSKMLVAFSTTILVHDSSSASGAFLSSKGVLVCLSRCLRQRTSPVLYWLYHQMFSTRSSQWGYP